MAARAYRRIHLAELAQKSKLNEMVDFCNGAPKRVKEKELFLMAGTIGEKERQLLQSLEEQLKEFKGAGEELSWASWTHEGHLWVRLAYIYRCT